MSEEWAERERRTNRLVRAVAAYVLDDISVSPGQLYGLCKLTWITKSFDERDAAYIKSTKIPALGNIFNEDYADASLEMVAADLFKTLGNESIRELVLGNTGFTNFYGAYRNSARTWIENHFSSLLSPFQRAFRLETDDDGLNLIWSISKLPRVPNAAADVRLKAPEHLLTPVFFAVDSRLRFPLINGNKGVQSRMALPHVR